MPKVAEGETLDIEDIHCIAKKSLTSALAVTSVVCDGAFQSVLHSMVRGRHLFSD